MPSWIQRAMMSSLRPERLWETPRAQRPCSFHDLRHPSGIAWAQCLIQAVQRKPPGS